MAKKIKLEFTTYQLNSVVDMIDDIESMIGCSDERDDGTSFDGDMVKRIQAFDRMLKSNGYNRNNYESN